MSLYPDEVDVEMSSEPRKVTAPPESCAVVLCPSCGHGIDPHGVDPGSRCGVGNEWGTPCECMWQPNDIAATLLAEVVQ